ncbi:MAG: response regulator transcription factor [Comamonadaceae bacterium]|nr:MAG: response regulator transcription factor [Comamonadaceae bacterium]
MRILVVEDDEGIAGGLKSHLTRLGWAVDLTDGVESAWSALCVEPVDLVLLDLGLRDGEGADVLRRLRRAPAGRSPDPSTPVLIMTARDQVSARIECLDMGADDYVTKPFDPDELAARIRALRRRAVGRAQPLLRAGDVAIDPAARTVLLKGRPVDLSSREFGVLLALVEVRPRVLSRTQIEASLYNFDNALDSNAVEVHVHHLRKKLGEKVIRTLRGVGYFVAEDAP